MECQIRIMCHNVSQRHAVLSQRIYACIFPFCHTCSSGLSSMKSLCIYTGSSILSVNSRAKRSNGTAKYCNRSRLNVNGVFLFLLCTAGKHQPLLDIFYCAALGYHLMPISRLSFSAVIILFFYTAVMQELSLKQSQRDQLVVL